MFCLYTGMFTTLVTRTAQGYHVAVIGFLVARLILISLSANALIYLLDILIEITATSFILISIINI
jgi:hypothetical protein